jgi:hypothetical protein
MTLIMKRGCPHLSVFIQDHNHALIEIRSTIHGLPRHTSSDCAIADDCDAVVGLQRNKHTSKLSLKPQVLHMAQRLLN